MTVRTRFAPSPTGSLHVGGARTALYCLLHARHHGGRFLLRVEDTDRARSSEEAAEGILRDLTWLGLDWDEGPGKPDPDGTGPYFQSQRLALYDEALASLVAADRAYEAWDSSAELAAARDAALAAKQNFRYRRRTWTDDEVAAFRAEGREPVLRFQAPDHAVHHDDAVLGRVTLEADDLDDLVIRKADGFPTYHFAVVVDDHLMGVTMVLRGQEHLMNTHKHLGLYDALGWTPPEHGHLPIIMNPTGGKMSKRNKAQAARAAARAAADGRDGWQWLADATGLPLDVVDTFQRKKHDRVDVAEAIAAALEVELPMIEVHDFRKGGYLPEALVNYLGLLGWSPGDDREILSLDDMATAWDLGRVNKTSARFDPDKLRWMNGEYVKASSIDHLVAAQDSYLEARPDSPCAGAPEALRRELLALYQPRIATFADLDVQARFFFEDPTSWDDKAVAKHLLKGDGLARLADLARLLEGIDDDDWNATDLVASLEGFAAAKDVGMGKVAQPLRVAVTGAGVSPGIGETLALLGKATTVRRLHACLAGVQPA